MTGLIRTNIRLSALLAVALAATWISAADDALLLPPAAQKTVDFVQEIQPIFQRTCYSCHGAEKQEAGLRLDIRNRALDGGDNGVVIVPGKSDQSRLILMVVGIDEDSGIMPPDGEGTPLTKEQIGLLRAWIDQGAKWPDGTDAALVGADHWSFQKVQRPPLPRVKDVEWVINPIDAFILARLEQERILPSPEADRTTLMRRLYFDLLGLPPTPAEVDAFVGDTRLGAYQRLVDRVLSSPHFGERWGRHWLDLARYADSDGYEKDRPRPHAWRYRQWVVEALNADMPFDLFSIEQIAGDMLPDATVEQRVASGFHRNTLHNTEGGTDKEEDRVKKTVDRINTIGAIWLGLTVGCAQCHSHKYDPLTQREYYSMYAFFNSIDEVDIDAPLPLDIQRVEDAKRTFDHQHAPLLAAVTQYEKTKLAAAQAKWEKSVSLEPTVWETLEVTATSSAKKTILKQQKDGSVLASGPNPKSDVYTVDGLSKLQSVTAIRLEVLPDKSLTKNGPGRSTGGNFVLSTLRLSVVPAGENAQPIEIPLVTARADFSQNGWPVVKAINDDPADGWAISPQVGKRHVAVFELAEAIQIDQGSKLSLTLDHNYRSGPHNLGRFRISLSNAPSPVSFDGLPALIAKILATPADQRDAAQLQQLSAYYRDLDPQLAQITRRVSDHAKQAPKGSGVKAQSVAQIAKLRPTNIHIRGDFLTKGDPVQPSTLEILPPLKPRGEQPDRLDFAQWIVDPANPLTARVTVNRLWQRIFGQGIVVSSDNFGAQGDRPTHPQLLDFLAAELVRDDWSLKNVLRLIVTSSTYRQSSTTRTELNNIDPNNSLLARQNRHRVEAEVIRDLALAVSGLLDSRLGGPAVRPPQPSEYTKLTYANSAKWKVSPGGDKYRRGLYTFFQRTSPYPMLMTFDSPDSNICVARRSMSNTPIQALTLWNDPVFVEIAQALGRRILREAPQADDDRTLLSNRAAYAFKLCMGRDPQPAELTTLVELYRAQWKLCAADKEKAALIIGQQSLPENVTTVELAAWVIVGRSLINLDEFITRE